MPGDNLHSFEEQISVGYLDSLDILIIEDAGCFNQRGSSGLFFSSHAIELILNALLRHVRKETNKTLDRALERLLWRASLICLPLEGPSCQRGCVLGESLRDLTFHLVAGSIVRELYES